MIVQFLNIQLDNEAIINFSKSCFTCISQKLAVQTKGQSTWKSDARPAALLPLISEVERRLEEITGEYKPVCWWFVLLPTGGQIQLHNHYQTDYSAVYYPMSSNNGGKLVFESGTQVEPVKGTLCCFPGLEKHYVTRYEGKRDRLSVAFNRMNNYEN